MEEVFSSNFWYNWEKEHPPNSYHRQEDNFLISSTIEEFLFPTFSFFQGPSAEFVLEKIFAHVEDMGVDKFSITIRDDDPIQFDHDTLLSQDLILHKMTRYIVRVADYLESLPDIDYTFRQITLKEQLQNSFMRSYYDKNGYPTSDDLIVGAFSPQGELAAHANVIFKNNPSLVPEMGTLVVKHNHQGKNLSRYLAQYLALQLSKQNIDFVSVSLTHSYDGPNGHVQGMDYFLQIFDRLQPVAEYRIYDHKNRYQSRPPPLDIFKIKSND